VVGRWQKKARLTKSLAGTGETKLEQLHACVNQIPGEESGLHLLGDVKREAVIFTVSGVVVRTYAIGRRTDCQRQWEYLRKFCPAASAAGSRRGGFVAVLRQRGRAGKFCGCNV
jgi:hypothetical protein